MGQPSLTVFAAATVLVAGVVTAVSQLREVPDLPEGRATHLSPTPTVERVLEPAVSGLFYPAEPEELRTAIQGYLSLVPSRPAPGLRALILPHAGYRYSGQTAAFGYKLLSGTNFRTVLLLSPTHYAHFQGVSLPIADTWRTPLGLLPISRRKAELAALPPFALEPDALVERPSWWRDSSLSTSPAQRDTAHTWEHSSEVHAPFLKAALPGLEVIPAVMGDVSAERVAQLLDPWLDTSTLVIASSDLSHYHPYDEAKAIDATTLERIVALDASGPLDACGREPIRVVLSLARARGWKAVLLDARNSGDTAGNKDRVVGYAAVAFFDDRVAPARPMPEAVDTKALRDVLQDRSGGASTPVSLSGEERGEQMETKAEFSLEERHFLLTLARRSLEAAVTTGRLPPMEASEVPPTLRQERGCFVTLTVGGQLRGCIGHIFAQEALFLAVRDNAKAAALEDPRFRPVSPAELKQIRVEVSVLSEPRPLPFNSPEELLEKLRPGTDGVVLKLGYRRATFLPQVWEQLPDKQEFLAHLSRKAGAGATSWRQAGTEVLIYHAEAFEEE